MPGRVAAVEPMPHAATATGSGASGPNPVPTGAAPRVLLDSVSKAYGSTVANAGITLSVEAGEVLGLVGANGAGKSTLMRVLGGLTRPDAGSLSLDGAPVDLDRYGPRAAHELGLRVVHQEGSLCANLSVAENFYLEQPDRTRPGPFWLNRFRAQARESIEAVFPRGRIDPDALVGELPLNYRQMVEIARAAGDPNLKLLILDEPTSSLDAERSRQLQSYLRRRVATGLSVIFISHKLGEVLAVADRVVVLRNGRLVRSASATATTVGQLVEAMGNAVEAEAARRRETDAPANGPVLARLAGPVTAPLGRPIELRGGEIVGLAGLEGSGQRRLLHALFGTEDGAGDVALLGPASFVSGDRQREGVFPLWSVLGNIALGQVASRPGWAPVSEAAETAAARPWIERLALDPSRLSSPILDLSGGNQQKALMARALVAEAAVILLDDPTRGVDIATKREFYRLAADLARSGRLLVWHSTEDAEFLECNRVLVLREGQIVRELVGSAISEEAIVQASFAQVEAPRSKAGRTAEPSSLGTRLLRLVPFAGLGLVFGAMAALNPNVASAFGLDLLLGPAVALVLLALAQMFVVGGSEIDLGLGAFVGLVNVVSATLLVSAPALGAAALAGGLAGYALLAILIQVRKIPAIVATLGASFVWAGLGHTLQPTPGGESPPWLSAVFTGWSIPGLPTPLMLIGAAGLAAVTLDRSPLGTVLRGFGNSPAALERSGWSAARYAVLRYLIAGSFATVAGLWLTASNNASDVNAGNSFTLLSIAAVVIGGCRLLGGVIAPAGVVAGAVTLSLIGALLAFLDVSTDYNAAVQGGLLIGILGLSAAAAWGHRRDA